MYECPNCGGNLKFDIPSQQLACGACDSHFSPYAFESKTSDAEESTFYETTVFTCPQCGGEITSTDVSAAEFCSFCGASTILFSRISNESRPKYIIPFQRTKEDCKKAYAALMKKAIFAPKEYRDPKKIDSFRGIYMPYWAFYITQKGPITLNGETSYRRGDYIIKDHYHMQAKIDAYYKGLSFDASSSFSDNISEAIAPYEVRTMKQFSPAFLSGFYADTSDVDASVYMDDANTIACEQSYKVIKSQPVFQKIAIKSDEDATHLNTRLESADLSMFPVWFMSYRNGDRIAYATVNGQTGKAAADIPVDIKKYLLGSLILAVPIFLLLNLFTTLKPSTLLAFVAVFSIITMLIMAIEASKIMQQESYADDKGYLTAQGQYNPAEMTAQKKAAAKKKQKPTIGAKLSMLVPIVYIVLLVLYFGITILKDSLDNMNPLWFVCPIFALIFGIIALINISHTKTRKGLVSILLDFVFLTIASGVAFIQPVYDFIYYAAAILLLIGIFLSLKEIMDQYNLLATRPLPQFKRTGGDDRA